MTELFEARYCTDLTQAIQNINHLYLNFVTESRDDSI